MIQPSYLQPSTTPFCAAVPVTLGFRFRIAIMARHVILWAKTLKPLNKNDTRTRMHTHTSGLFHPDICGYWLKFTARMCWSSSCHSTFPVSHQ